MIFRRMEIHHFKLGNALRIDIVNAYTFAGVVVFRTSSCEEQDPFSIHLQQCMGLIGFKQNYWDMFIVSLKTKETWSLWSCISPFFFL